PSRVLLEESVRKLTTALQDWLQADPIIPHFLSDLLVAQITEELQALTEEFETCGWDPNTETLYVETPRILLEEVDLGPFEIRLEFPRLANTPAYHTVPGEPCYGAGSTDYPHPHVNGTRLCEGEGTVAIKTALQGGRLSEFFLMVRQILQTYNSESAYLSLDDWWHTPCRCCGEPTDLDVGCTCSECSVSLCSTCGFSCEHCNVFLCDECHKRCDVCQRVFCTSCQGTCTNCQRSHLCEECLDENFHCPDCRDSDDEDSCVSLLPATDESGGDESDGDDSCSDETALELPKPGDSDDGKSSDTEIRIEIHEEESEDPSMLGESLPILHQESTASDAPVHA
ncbi:MAG: hypothetical protein KDA36_12130, partial [Planctomycetaceae bacterium]|nr:hypothetical protein [Planctomycetaceae bacterium]